MSTTLKALQRIEQERDHHKMQEPAQALPTQIGMHAGSDKFPGWAPIRDWLPWHKIVAIAILAGLGLMLSVFLIPRHPLTAFPEFEAALPQPPLPDEEQQSALGAQPTLSDEEIRMARSMDPDPAPAPPDAAQEMVSAEKIRPKDDPAPEAAQARAWQGDGIKVQAIVYGLDPAGRMAVINNRIVRQGDAQGGFTVLSIENDAVIIGTGRERWRVPLGR